MLLIPSAGVGGRLRGCVYVNDSGLRSSLESVQVSLELSFEVIRPSLKSKSESLQTNPKLSPESVRSSLTSRPEVNQINKVKSQVLSP